MKLSEQVAELEAQLIEKNRRIFALREKLCMCIEYLECIPETAAGGDDEAGNLVRKAIKLLDRNPG
jgi:hypothetical protein